MQQALNRCARIAGVVGVSAAYLFADIGSPRPNEVGVGARAFALGNNYTALAEDFAALYHNPAGLGFVHAREAHLSLGGWALQTTNTSGKLTQEASRQRLRLSSSGMVWAVPATRGGLAFALGYHCPYLFDEAMSYGAASGIERKDKRIDSHGQLNFWTAGFGLQLAPGFSGGLSAALVTGNAKIDARGLHYRSDSLLTDLSYSSSISRNYVGYDIRLGLKYAPNDMLSVGMRFVFPRRVRVHGYTDDRILSDPNKQSEFSGRDYGYLRGRPELSVGGALRLPFLLVSPEIRVRAPDPWFPADSGSYDALYWKLDGGVGAEVPVFSTGLLVRLGYHYAEYDQQPMVSWYLTDDREHEYIALEPLREVKRNQHLFTGGLAFITKSAVSFELSYGYHLWEYDLLQVNRFPSVNQIYAYHQALFAVSLRY